mgnify:CR=1 FL=1|tara:strand:- start:2374 stop:4035 length:1662 start_codon:yes stop_codon:yes gene_type:complete
MIEKRTNTINYLRFKLISFGFLFVIFLVSCNFNASENTSLDPKEKQYNAIINSSQFAFPDGKLKCLVMSFDDGPEYDRLLIEKLNDVNIVGTFHLNSVRLGQKAEWLSSEFNTNVTFVSESEIASLYNGHEISGHGAHHNGLNNQKDSIILAEVGSDLIKLNELKGNNHKPVEGLAYPFGAYDDKTLEILKQLKVKYARTTASTHNFELPSSNFLTLNPTCHILEAPNYASYFRYSQPNEMQLLNIWGHSYEFHNNWELADSLCNILGNQKDIWYAQTIEVVDYLNAIKNLEYSKNKVFNPSKTISVWVKNEKGSFIELLPKQSMLVPFQTSYLVEKHIDSLYPSNSTQIEYHGLWTKVHYKQRIAQFKKAPLNFGDIVFVGNSITEQGENWSKKLNLKNVKNRGIAGDVTDGVLERLDEIIYYKPKKIFLLIGINDLFNLHYEEEIPSAEYVADNIIKITETIQHKSPETKIYLQTILPTSKDFMADNINKVNSIIKNHESDGNYKIINLFDVFANEKGLLKDNLTTDGTHLNELGYKHWVEKLKKEKVFGN